MKFYQLTHLARCQYLRDRGLLSAQQLDLLISSTTPEIHAVNSRCSENVLGAWPFPFSVVPDFPLPWGACCVPMVIEETSVVAALNYAAKWVRSSGRVSSSVEGWGVWGQIILTLPLSPQDVHTIEKNKASWLKALNNGIAVRMVARGGGIKNIRVRQGLGPDRTCASIDYLVDTADAMGANFINQVGAELMRLLQQADISVMPTAIILSNHQPDFLVRAQVVIDDFPAHVGTAFVALGDYAYYDKYRAVTHNKGIMNGVDAVLLATGNDWRAASSAIHAFASDSGRYQPLSSWSYHGGALHGQITFPAPCATGGGATSVHPMAQLAQGLLGNPGKKDLMQILALVGLLQNFSALRALVDEGITAGHMRLHIPNFITALGVDEPYWPVLTAQAEALLLAQGSITQADVASLYKGILAEEGGQGG